tara:strand:+ start:286 stop:534 length:249 start_codon:yes stop_codon:yes gene_type:complete
MIFNIPLETFRTIMPLEQGIIYYLEKEERIELYLPQGNIILKAIYIKQGTEQDLIWRDDNLKKAMRVISIEKGDVTFKITKE